MDRYPIWWCRQALNICRMNEAILWCRAVGTELLRTYGMDADYQLISTTNIYPLRGQLSITHITLGNGLVSDLRLQTKLLRSDA